MTLPDVLFNTRPMIHRCEELWSWKPRELTDYDIWCVLAGAGSLKLGGFKYKAERGFCLIMPPGSRPEGSHNPKNPLVVFSVHFEFTDAPLSRQGGDWLPKTPVRIGDAATMESSIRSLVSLSRRQSPLSSPRLQLLFWQIVLHISDSDPTRGFQDSDRRIQRLIGEIDENPGKDFAVARMSMHANLSRAQLTRLFIKATGFSPGRYVIQSKINRAQLLLSETDLSVGEIAYSLGYIDVSYFSRQFKMVTGMNAKQYRKRS